MLRKAVAVVRGESSVTGNIIITQDSKDSKAKISWSISGLGKNAKQGMHIHAYGDNTNGCTSAGPHFNPFDHTHGAPEDKVRHVGDLGNILSNAEGVSEGEREDGLVTLFGDNSVIGRSVVVHAGTDDLGKLEGDAESKKTGNAGARQACGVIGLVEVKSAV